ncbi:hypothetical protein TspCOW1_21550 [Thiohalobacter sp. COW1]|uniref:hypothetical protein n=1 Tax=Thiohalobacter sp. COW1 TaxID=2795687 RepID=UPI001915E963|nr:hypothetical protein [Thiohalobacter sp. COW1]BCO32052.1 hypothetical protein TspCOW1_21550 [Thiohalobacter sp. COW1]
MTSALERLQKKVRQELAEGKVQRITRAQSGSPWVTPADYDEDPDDPLLTLARDIHRALREEHDRLMMMSTWLSRQMRATERFFSSVDAMNSAMADMLSGDTLDTIRAEFGDRMELHRDVIMSRIARMREASLEEIQHLAAVTERDSSPGTGSAAKDADAGQDDGPAGGEVSDEEISEMAAMIAGRRNSTNDDDDDVKEAEDGDD